MDHQSCDSKWVNLKSSGTYSQSAPQTPINQPIPPKHIIKQQYWASIICCPWWGLSNLDLSVLNWFLSIRRLGPTCLRRRHLNIFSILLDSWDFSWIPLKTFQIYIAKSILSLYQKFLASIFKVIHSYPGWCGSVAWATACKLKGCRFNSQSGYMSGLWAGSPAGGMQEATDPFISCTSVFLSLCFSLSLSK